LVTRDTISGWGGINEREGTVIERRHELRGVSFKDKVLVFPGAKGSSGWSAYFHMTRLNGVAPKAMIFNKMTTKVALGAVVTHAPSDFIHSAGHRGNYIRPMRDLITNDMEVRVAGARLDGMICLTSCDKTVPGHLMAAARLDIPTLLVPCGYQPSGVFNNHHV